MASVRCWLPPVLAAWACSADAGSVGDGATEDGGAEGTPTGGETDQTWGPTDDGAGGGTDTTGAAPDPEPPPPWAHGIVLTRITANQGVAVTIADGREWVDGSGRNAPLIAGRETLVQAIWEVQPGWQPRTIRGVLTLGAPDGTSETSQHDLPVGDAPSTFASDNLSFAWRVPSELIVPGTTFSVELLEVDGPGDGDVPEPPPVYPSEPGLLGIEDGDQVIRVTLVPVRHTRSGSCDTVATPTDDDVAVFAELLHQRNPTQRVEIDVREPLDFSESLAGYSDLLIALSQLRFDDDAPPRQYYYGLVHECVRTGGQAIALGKYPPTKEDAWMRTAVGPWRGSAAVSSSTFVHEIGHTLGRRHVECSGSEGGPDPSYPYPDGNIGVWGYAVHVPDPKLGLGGNRYDPDTTWDYMGYCTGSHWVSDYGWRLVHPFIAEVSSWDGQGADRPRGELLIGLFDPDGTDRWFTVPGEAVDREGAAGYALTVGVDDGTRSVPLARVERPVAGAYALVAALPPDADTRRITLRTPLGRRQLTTVRRFGR